MLLASVTGAWQQLLLEPLVCPGCRSQGSSSYHELWYFLRKGEFLTSPSEDWANYSRNKECCWINKYTPVSHWGQEHPGTRKNLPKSGSRIPISPLAAFWAHLLLAIVHTHSSFFSFLNPLCWWDSESSSPTTPSLFTNASRVKCLNITHSITSSNAGLWIGAGS